jgi:hypothetical protein
LQTIFGSKLPSPLPLLGRIVFVVAEVVGDLAFQDQ